MEIRKCTHCGTELSKIDAAGSDFGAEFLYVCFNDECSYYTRGWEWMRTNYAVNASYRYMWNPENGADGPIPVNSPYTYRDSICM